MTPFKLHLKSALLCAVLLIMAWATVGCASESPPTPTATPVPVKPTSTPTATPVPPTPTPEPTATPKPTPIREAASVRPTPRLVSQPPEAAQDFEVETFDGETLRLSDLKGKVVVLNFWASWCPPCRWEMPSFERVSKEYSDEEVVFVGLALSDTLRDARGFADSVGVTYPLALDSTGRIAVAFNVRSLPTTFFIDREGQIQRRLTSVANEGVLKIFIRGQLTPTPGQGK